MFYNIKYVLVENLLGFRKFSLARLRLASVSTPLFMDNKVADFEEEGV
jgi:hypothetical protein